MRRNQSPWSLRGPQAVHCDVVAHCCKVGFGCDGCRGEDTRKKCLEGMDFECVCLMGQITSIKSVDVTVMSVFSYCVNE